MFINSWQQLIVVIPALLLTISFHEYAHGKLASLLGDPTPAATGRLSLNPLKHLDPIGTLMLILVGFGWAKPVQVNPSFFQGNKLRGMMYVGLAGPGMNLVLAYLAAVALHFIPSGGLLFLFFYMLLWYNAMLAIFNLIPIPPLDGSRVLAGLLPPKAGLFIYRLEQYGPVLLFILLITGIVGRILMPAVQFIINLFLTLAGYTLF